MNKDKEKETEGGGDKKRNKLQKSRWSWNVMSANTISRSPSGDDTLDYLKAKYPKIHRKNLTNPNFRKLLLFSEDTIVLGRDYRYKLIGAQNLNGITCFLNATLFAMFCRSDSCFDTLLYSAFDGPVGRFATMVRLWVNMLRSGWFISTDVVAQLRENLAQCGWEVARMDQQQDASECYIHIVEYLKLPKSTLQTQVAHGAKSNMESDFKFETEYLLDCAIPNKPPAQPIFLDDCLFDYFTNIVQVRRQLLTPGDLPPTINYSTKPRLFSSSSSSSSSSRFANQSPPPPYVGDGNGFYGVDEKAALKKSSQLQESNVSAWQFFKLVPYYVPTSSGSEMAVQLANERPILGICLKRYGYDAIRKQPYRNGRTVLIPKYIELSNFVMDEQSVEGRPPRKYRLVFYSSVCHRGQYVHSGHYVSIVWDRQNDRWLHFDDVASEKITTSSPEYLFFNETPYILFYQLEEISDPFPKNPGIHVPPSIPMPEIPPPPTRPPPPIPETLFVSKETNQITPSPVDERPETPPAYQYSESEPQTANSSMDDYLDSSSPNTPAMSKQYVSSPTTYLPPSSPTRPPPLPPYAPPLPPLRIPTTPPPSTQPPPIPLSSPPPEPSRPPPPPPTRLPPPAPGFVEMPESPMISDQPWSQQSTSPPMPSYPPPLPPQVSSVHDIGSNEMTHNYLTAEPLDMPETPVIPVQEGRLFNMDDEEDLYGEMPDGSRKYEDKRRRSEVCIVQ